MPGFIIHIAVGKQYMKKKSDIKNEEDFIKGITAPDFEEDMKTTCKNKTKTHYEEWLNGKRYINIKHFLEDSKVDIKQDFWKGYMLHLITDYYFYNKYFKKETQKIIENNEGFYNDYDCLNNDLIKLYNIDITDNIKRYVGNKDEGTKYLKKDKIIKFIEKISEKSLNEYIELINKKGMEELD